MFLLDTDHVVILQRSAGREFENLVHRMRRFGPEDFYISIVTFQEEVNGWNAYLNRARTPETIARAYGEFGRILGYFARSRWLPFDQHAAGVFESLRRQRVRIGTMDLRIASTALARGYTVLTRNLADFQQVPSLRVEDWTSEP